MSILEGQVVAITGGASGIGLACARQCLAAGAQVALVDRDEAALRDVCADLGAGAHPVVTDLLVPDSVAADPCSGRPAGCVSRQCRRLCGRRCS